MNLLLLRPHDLESSDHAVVTDERCDHVRKILKAAPGDRLRVGMLNGTLGWATIRELTRARLVLELDELVEDPPPPLDVELVLALPRPKFVGRIFQAATAIGVKRIVLAQTARVEKSFWHSSVLEPGAIERHLVLGLEQARDTVLPAVELVRSWRDLIGQLEGRDAGRRLLLAHAEAPAPFPRGPVGPATLLVGPEGGLVEREIGQLTHLGAEPVTLGTRALRVETAVAVLLGRLVPDAEASRQ